MSTDFPPGTPNWVDLATTDVAGATSFYDTLFDWTVEDLGPDSGGYGMIRKNGRMVAGIGLAANPGQPTAWSVYFATDSADDTAAKIRANGGTVVLEPMDVMEQGRMAVCQDPAGAFFSVWQPGQHRGAEVIDEPGTLNWVELMTTDIPATKTFYEAVFGVSTRDVEMGPPGMVYTLLSVGEKAVAGAMPIGPEHGPMPSHWTVYFTVEDCDAVADHAAKLGGGEMLRDDSPAGRFAFLTDPQGGAFSIIQPNPDFVV